MWLQSKSNLCGYQEKFNQFSEVVNIFIVLLLSKNKQLGCEVKNYKFGHQVKFN